MSEGTGPSSTQGPGKVLGKMLLAFCVVKVTNKVEIEEKFQLTKEGVPTLTKSLTCEDLGLHRRKPVGEVVVPG